MYGAGYPPSMHPPMGYMNGPPGASGAPPMGPPGGHPMRPPTGRGRGMAPPMQYGQYSNYTSYGQHPGGAPGMNPQMNPQMNPSMMAPPMGMRPMRQLPPGMEGRQMAGQPPMMPPGSVGVGGGPMASAAQMSRKGCKPKMKQKNKGNAKNSKSKNKNENKNKNKTKAAISESEDSDLDMLEPPRPPTLSMTLESTRQTNVKASKSKNKSSKQKKGLGLALNITVNKRKLKPILKDKLFGKKYMSFGKTEEKCDYLENILHEQNKMLLFLDIDHTLLHSTKDERGGLYVNHKDFGQDVYGIKFGVNTGSGNIEYLTYFVKFRPYFNEFIKCLRDKYDIVLYTMGSRGYAEQVAALIDEIHPQLIGTRIVCREDHKDDNGNSSTTSTDIDNYKKNICEFAPVNSDWCMIMDDTPEIWVNANDVHRVPKYLFWPNPENFYPGTSNKASSAQHSKNSPSSWDDERTLYSQDKDVILKTATNILTAVHTCYFEYYDPLNPIRAPNILSLMRKRSLLGCNISFTGLFPSGVDGSKDRHWKHSIEYGAKCQNVLNENTTHLIANDRVTAKVREAKENSKLCKHVKIVHVNWLWQSMYHFSQANPNKFALNLRTPKVFPPMVCCIHSMSI